MPRSRYVLLLLFTATFLLLERYVVLCRSGHEDVVDNHGRSFLSPSTSGRHVGFPKNERECRERYEDVYDAWKMYYTMPRDRQSQFTFSISKDRSCPDELFSACILSHMRRDLRRSSALCVASLKMSRGMTREIAPVARYYAIAHDRNVTQGLPLRVATKEKLLHDAEQFQYLIDRGMISRSYEVAVRTLKEIHADTRDGWIGFLPLKHYLRVDHFFNRLVHVRPPARLKDGERVLGDIDMKDVRSQFVKRQVAVVDNLLSPRALHLMRRWLLESTLWFDSNPRGYVGAYFEQGLTSPFLLQLIEELRSKFPLILGPHFLSEVWAYKYDSEAKGIKIHADLAAVNLNFWITPDDANLNKSSGGLVVYRREAPQNWKFADFNSERGLKGMKEIVRGSEIVRVPYRQNRLVMFNSNYFHNTDDFEFKKGYENRRINLTFLFGRRRNAGKIDALIHAMAKDGDVAARDL